MGVQRIQQMRPNLVVISEKCSSTSDSTPYDHQQKDKEA